MNISFKADVTMEPVTSSNVSEMGYNKEKGILAIQFKGRSLYHYYNVPETIWKGLQSAESKGKYILDNVVRAPYEFELITK